MVTTLPNTIWMPTVNSGLGNGTYSTIFTNEQKRVRVVLYTTNSYTPVANEPKPAHFSIDVRTAGKTWQHVDLLAPAYGLAVLSNQQMPDGSTKTVDLNKDTGRTIQVAVLAPELYTQSDPKGWWTDERLQRLGNLLGRLCAVDLEPATEQYLSVPSVCPFPFDASKDKPDNSRKNLEAWRLGAGIVGRMHATGSAGQWGPGALDRAKLADYSRANEAPAEKAQEEGRLVEVMAASATAPDKVIFESSTEGKEFRFNPPLHRMNIPVRVDFSSSDPSMARYQDEPARLSLGQEGVKVISGLRLGRIVQHEMAAGRATLNEFRYGFRFLYNPTTVSLSASRNDSFFVDPSSTHDAIISGINQNFQTITLDLLLNRQPDLIFSPLLSSDYKPAVSNDDIAKIRELGTHYDLEFLYKACNGTWDLEDRGKTSDIGLLIPASMRLMLGPGQNHFGFVQSLSYTDQKFTKNMVPMLTVVNLMFRRHVDMEGDDVTQFASATTHPEGPPEAVSWLPHLDLGGGDPVATGPGLDPMGLWRKCGLYAAWTYGNKDPSSREVRGGLHKAWDISARYEPLLAGVDGVVGGFQDGVGEENHAPGSPSNRVVVWTTYQGGPASVYYQHLHRGVLVKKGQAVTKTSLIGKTGNTGYSTGPHLHLATMKGHLPLSRVYDYEDDASILIYPPSLLFEDQK